MEIVQSFESILHGVIAGAMVIPIIASVVLGVICVVWNAFN